MARERIPPHDLEAEQSVLGGILIDSKAVAKIAPNLSEKDFYRSAHAKIYASMVSLWEKSEPIDLVTLARDLSAKESLESVGGRAYLMELTTIVPTAANIVNYAGIVKRLAVLRSGIEIASSIADASFNTELTAEEFAAIVGREAMKVSNGAKTGRSACIKDAVSEFFDTFGESQRAIKTGFIDLDRCIGGFREDELVIIAARPSVGKSSLAVNLLMSSVYKQKEPSMLFSLEMSKKSIVERMLSIDSRIPLSKIRSGAVSADEMNAISNSMGVLSGGKLEIDDSGSTSVMGMRAAMSRFSAEHGKIGLVAVDYLQLMESPGKKHESRVQEISAVTRGLKQAAKEFKCPIIALSQLSRAAEETNQRPKLSHLRESGSIEQDADIVMMIYRPQEQSIERSNVSEIIVAKQRNGPVGVIDLYFRQEFSSFESFDGSRA
jgi:replicative DNA helicase